MTNPFRLLFSLDKSLVKIEKILLIVCFIALVLFAFLQVVLRNFFDTGIHWADVFNRLLVLWIGIFAATVAASENKHLSLEVLTKFLPEWAWPVVNIFTNIFVIVVAAFATYYSYLFFQDQLMYESADLLFQGVPKAYFSVVFPVGFGLISFRYFVKLLKGLYQVGGGDRAYPKYDGPVEISDNIGLKEES